MSKASYSKRFNFVLFHSQYLNQRKKEKRGEKKKKGGGTGEMNRRQHSKFLQDSHGLHPPFFLRGCHGREKGGGKKGGREGRTGKEKGCLGDDTILLIIVLSKGEKEKGVGKKGRGVNLPTTTFISRVKRWESEQDNFTMSLFYIH